MAWVLQMEEFSEEEEENKETQFLYKRSNLGKKA